jgi:hypothetical protein
MLNNKCWNLEARRRWPGERFAECFQQVWAQLPSGVKAKLLKHWRANPGRLQIVLSNSRLCRPGLAACCGDGGYTLVFALYFDLIPAANTIAHELAHAYREACGINQWLELVQQCETETNRLAESWGFPQEPFRESDYAQEIALQKRIKELDTERRQGEALTKRNTRRGR